MNNVQRIIEHFLRATRSSQDGERLLFCTSDVCRELGLSPLNRVTRRLPPDEQTKIRVASCSGQMETLSAITEPGLYLLILDSDTPLAVEFQSWLFRQALPPIMAQKRKELIFAFEAALSGSIQMTILQHARNMFVFFHPDTLRRFHSLAKTEQVRAMIHAMGFEPDHLD